MIIIVHDVVLIVPSRVDTQDLSVPLSFSQSDRWQLTLISKDEKFLIPEYQSLWVHESFGVALLVFLIFYHYHCSCCSLIPLQMLSHFLSNITTISTHPSRLSTSLIYPGSTIWLFLYTLSSACSDPLVSLTVKYPSTFS